MTLDRIKIFNVDRMGYGKCRRMVFNVGIKKQMAIQISNDFFKITNTVFYCVGGA